MTWEWRTALDRKGIEGIQLHPLQTVAEALPPEELKVLHFSDVHMIVREMERDFLAGALGRFDLPSAKR